MSTELLQFFIMIKEQKVKDDTVVAAILNIIYIIRVTPYKYKIIIIPLLKKIGLGAAVPEPLPYG